MLRPHRPLDLVEVLNTSFSKREAFENMKVMVEDHKRVDRLAAQECPVCFYYGKMGGAMMTSSHCGLCEKVMGFCSTCVDRLCIDCARAHRLCKHCGGDIEMKQRRKL